MSGTLFINGYKKTDNHPDYTGSCKIESVDYKIAGWKKATSSGKAMLSLSFKVDEPQEENDKPVGPIDEIMF
jgi:uncharacterized protein (DUF736 family)